MAELDDIINGAFDQPLPKQKEGEDDADQQAQAQSELPKINPSMDQNVSESQNTEVPRLVKNQKTLVSYDQLLKLVGDADARAFKIYGVKPPEHAHTQDGKKISIDKYKDDDEKFWVTLT